MMRLTRAATARRSATVLLGAAALAVTATPAYADYEDAGTGCRSGGSGRACAHVEIDRTTGNIRARGAGDTDPQSGNVILLDYTKLEQRITEISTGQATVTDLPGRDDGDVVSTDAPVYQITKPNREVCDSTLRRVEYRANVKYYVRGAGGATPYSITSDWRPGRC